MSFGVGIDSSTEDIRKTMLVANSELLPRANCIALSSIIEVDPTEGSFGFAGSGGGSLGDLSDPNTGSPFANRLL